MPKPRVYVETTIPNFYYDFRDSPAVRQRRELTREWWGDATGKYELLTGAPVLGELLAGISNRVPSRIRLLGGLPLLVPDAASNEVAEVYIRNKLMPGNPSEDALHLALASCHCCDLIVTWNCKHLANPKKFKHLERINTRLGLYVPTIATPAELLRRTA